MGCTGSKHTAPPEPLKALHTAPSVSLEESQTAPSVSLEASQTAPTVPPGALRFEVAATLESTLADWRAVGLDPEIEPLDSVLNTEDGLFCLSKGGEFASKLRNIVAAKHPGLLAATNVANEEGAKLRELGTVLSKDPKIAASLRFPLLPFVPTAADTFITDRAGSTISKLVTGGFAGHHNGHSVVMIGPRGSGKTYSLRRLAVTAALRHRNLRVVYINAKGIGHERHAIQMHGGLCELLLQLGLQAEGGATPTSPSSLTSPAAPVSGPDVHVMPPSQPVSSVGASSLSPTASSGSANSGYGQRSLGAYLRSHRLFLLIVVDEMDSLYESDTKAALTAVLDLSMLADVDHGHSAVICASSSSLTYPLVKGGHELKSPLLASIFHLANKQPLPDMNGEKLRLLDIPAARFGIDSVLPFCVPGAQLSAVRVVMFCHGAYVRGLYGRGLRKPLAAPYVHLTTSSTPRADRTAYLTSEPGTLALLLAAFDVLEKRNEKLLRSVLNPLVPLTAPLINRIDLHAVGAIDWEVSFRGLDAGEIRSIAKSLWPADGPNDGEVENMLWFLHADSALLSVVREEPDVHQLLDYPVMPSSPLAVLLHADWRRKHRFTLTDSWRVVATSLTDTDGILRALASSSTYKALFHELVAIAGTAKGVVTVKQA